MKKLLLVANLSITFSFLTISFSYSQIAVNSAATPAQMVTNLVGPGITFSNVTYTGDNVASGIFTNGNVTNLGMTSGVALTSGSAALIPINNSGNQGVDNAGITIPELDAIAGDDTYDGVILEFDFIPYSNSINVRYIFGSEEYLEWVNAGYNDAFAFYISGPGIVGQQNIATVAGQPVTIDNINTTSNPGFYVNNPYDGSLNNNRIEYDGFTAPLLATRAVIPCSTYHIKLMIADGGDAIYDSGVFIEENGLFSSGAITDVTVQPAYGFGSGIEGCLGSQFVFTMPGAVAGNTTFNYTVGGTATSGADYVPIPTSVTIPAGQTTASVPVTIISDGIAEGAENVTITVQISPCSTQTFTLTINDPTPISVTAADASFCQGTGPVNISATATGGNGIITYTWDNGAGNGTPVSVNPGATTTYTVTATDQCGRTATDPSTVTVTPPPTSTFTATGTVCQGTASTLTYTGNAPAGATYTWGFAGGTAAPGGTTQGPHNVTWGTAGTYNVSLTVNQNGCISAPSTQTVTVTPTPTTPTAGSNSPICTGNSINLTANTIAGATYYWTGPNGFTSSVEDPSIANATVGMAGTYNLYVVVNNCTSATAAVPVLVNTTPVTPTITSNTPVCSGNAINLTSNTIAGATYTWTGPNGFTSALEDPSLANSTVAMSGTYNLYVTVTGCTSGTASTAVVVNPTPATPVVAANSPVCSGNAINLTSNTLTGTYNWTGPNGFTSSVEDPTIANATVGMSGTYNLYLTATGCTSATASVPVVVNPTPATPVVASNSPVCSGNAINLTSNTIAGTTYNWTGPNGFTSAVEDPTIANATVAMTGTYNLYLTATGCTSATANVNVTVNQTPATPVVASNSPVCSGNPINLTSNTIAATYNWTGPNGFTSSAEDPTIANATVGMGGTYNLYLTALGCTSVTASVPVVVNPTPATPVVASNSPVCSGNAINLTSNTIAGTTYNWTGPNGFTSAVEDPTIANATVAMTGTYNLYLTATGCTSATANVNVTVNQTPATPVVASNSPVCSGNSINLTSNTIAATYNWTGPNGFTSSVEDPTIANATVGMGGTYNLYLTALGCTSVTASVPVVVNQTPATPVVASNSPVCSGNAINLTSNTIAATYNWTGPNGFTSTVEDPTIANATVAMGGTYNLYLTAIGCTSATANVNVTVNQTPATPVVASNSPVCSGNSINLTSNTIAATYNWTGPAGFTSAVEDPTITGSTVAMGGTYNLYLTALGCTSATASVPVVVNQTPALPVIASNSPVCENGTLNLTANTVAGGTYSWSGPNGFTATVEDPSIAGVTLAATGSYSLYVTVTGCSSATANLNASITPLPATPTAGSNSPVCENGTINLTSTTLAGATYHWSGPAGFASTVEDPSISPAGLTMNGNYSVYVVANACTSATATTPVVVNATPVTPVVASNSPVCAGNALNLTANTIANATYVWSGPNSFTSSVEDPSIASATLAAGGSYSLYVTVNGCSSATANVNTVVNPIPAAPAIASNGPVCQSDVLNLTANTIAGATYAWSGPAGFTSSVEDPTITPAAVNNAGNYNAYVVVLGCTSSTATVAVVVNATPATPIISNSSPVCEGGLIQLTSNSIAGATYHWSGPSSYSSSTEDPTLTPASLSMGGNYTLYVSVNNCNSATATTVVVVNPLPATPVISSNTPICVGGTLNLTSNSGANLTNYWTGPNGFTSSDANPSVPATGTNMSGNYSLYAVALGCTSATVSTPVVVKVKPTADFAVTAQICLGSDAYALYSGAAPAGATYGWQMSSGANHTGSGQGPITIDWATSGTQTVTLTVTQDGCPSDPVSHNVVVIAPVTPDAGPDQTMCSGATIGVGVQNATGANFTWTTPNGITDPTSAYSTASWNNNGNTPITVTITLESDNQGCLATDNAVITVIPNPTASFNNQIAQCFEGNRFDFVAGGTFMPTATFLWSFSNANPSSSLVQNPSNVQFNATGNNDVTLVISQNGCVSAPFTGSVMLVPSPQANFAHLPAEGCSPLEVAFTNLSNPATGLTFEWSFGYAGAGANVASPSFTYTQPGVYSVGLTVTDANGCTSNLTRNNIIHVHDNPSAGFAANPMQIYIDEPFANIYDGSSSDVVSWNYEVESVGNFSVPQFTVNFTDTGWYNITQTVTNEFGCSDVFLQAVHVLPVSQIYVPNAFTPGSRDDLNQYFKPYGYGLSEYKMYIYNRWGEMLFSTADIEEGWDGQVRRSDVEAKQDLYVYKIEYVDHRGNPKELLGNVMVLR